jgi:hypothetical protein
VANSPEAAAGKRLGDLLVRRRIELNPAWRSRKAFAAEHQLQYRIINDLENGIRFNFEPATIAAAESAYKLAPGSLRHTLAGGQLEETPSARGLTAAPEPEVTELEARTRDMLAAAVRDTMTEIRAEIDAALEKNPAADGWDIFPGEPVLAQIWGYDVLSEHDRIEAMTGHRLLTRKSARRAAPATAGRSNAAP